MIYILLKKICKVTIGCVAMILSLNINGSTPLAYLLNIMENIYYENCCTK